VGSPRRQRAESSGGCAPLTRGLPAVGAADPRVHYRRRVIAAALGFLAGVGLLLAGSAAVAPRPPGAAPATRRPSTPKNVRAAPYSRPFARRSGTASVGSQARDAASGPTNAAGEPAGQQPMRRFGTPQAHRGMDVIHWLASHSCPQGQPGSGVIRRAEDLADEAGDGTIAATAASFRGRGPLAGPPAWLTIRASAAALATREPTPTAHLRLAANRAGIPADQQDAEWMNEYHQALAYASERA
jgi:hypothetical protein